MYTQPRPQNAFNLQNVISTHVSRHPSQYLCSALGQPCISPAIVSIFTSSLAPTILSWQAYNLLEDQNQCHWTGETETPRLPLLPHGIVPSLITFSLHRRKPLPKFLFSQVVFSNSSVTTLIPLFCFYAIDHPSSLSVIQQSSNTTPPTAAPLFILI